MPAMALRWLLLACVARSVAQYYSAVYAGGYGDGGPAAGASVSSSSQLSLDSNGNLLIADASHNCIRRVNRTSGIIQSIAGDGRLLSRGDGGPATSASIQNPRGIAVDVTGNIYFSESSVIRMVKPSGVVIPVAGSGQDGFSGDGGPATASSLNYPYALTTDLAGNLFIADYFNHRVRKVTVATGVITTFAGNGTANMYFIGDGLQATAAALYNIGGLAYDRAAGVLYISDAYHQRIRKVASNGVITTVAGTGASGYAGDGGAAVAAMISYPGALFVDAAGSLTFVDASRRIRRVTAGVVTTIAGSTAATYDGGEGVPATSASLCQVSGMTVNSTGSVMFADSCSRVRTFRVGGIITTYAGGDSATSIGNGLAATSGIMMTPRWMALNAADELYISDLNSGTVRKVSRSTGIITTVAGNGSTFSAGDNGQATAASLNRPGGVAFDVAGNLYIAESYGHRIRKVATNGMITTIAGTGTNGFSGDGGPATAAAMYTPQALAFDRTYQLHFVDSNNARVRKVTAAGAIMSTVAGTGSSDLGGDGGPASAASLDTIGDIAFDNAGNLYITQPVAGSVRMVSAATGVISTVMSSTVLGDGVQTVQTPMSVAFDPVGDMYVVDRCSGRVLLVPVSSTPSVVLGPNSILDGGLRGLCNVFNAGSNQYVGAEANIPALPTYIVRNSAGIMYLSDFSAGKVFSLTPAPALTKVQPSVSFHPIAPNNVTVSLVIAGLPSENRTSGVSTVSVGTSTCKSLLFPTPWTVNCTGVTIATTTHTTVYPLSIIWNGMPLQQSLTFTIVKPPFITAASPSRVLPGDTLLLNGYNFQSGNTTSIPVVIVGGVPCTNVQVLSVDTQLSCTLPSIAATAPNYPVLAVAVGNYAGQWSSQTFVVEYPVQVGVLFYNPPSNLSAFPSSEVQSIPVTPALALLVAGRGAITCSLAISGACTCSNTNAGTVSPVLVGLPAASVNIISGNNITVFSPFGVYAPSNCTCNLAAQCRDTQGNSASTAATVPLKTPPLVLSWAGNSAPSSIVLPVLLPALVLRFGAPAGTTLLQLPLAFLECSAVLVPASTFISVAAPLLQAVSQPLSFAATANAYTQGVGGHANVSYTGLSCASCSFNSTYSVHVECRWSPTGERVRVSAPARLTTPAVTIVTSTSTMSVDAYTAITGWSAALQFSADGRAAGLNFSTSAGVCTYVTINSTNPALRMSSTTLLATLSVLSNGSIVVPAASLLMVEGPPSETMFWRLQCSVWGKVVVGPPISLITMPFIAAMVLPPVSSSHAQLASASVGSPLLPLPPLQLLTHLYQTVTCALAIVPGSLVCPSVPLGGYGVGRAATALACSLVGEVTFSVSSENTSAGLAFPNVGITGGGGCRVNISASCRDAAGRLASTLSMSTAPLMSLTSLIQLPGSLVGAVPTTALLPSIQVTLLQLRGDWTEVTRATNLSAVRPIGLPVLSARLLAFNLPNASVASLDGSAVASLSCYAAIVSVDASIAWPIAPANTAANAVSACTASIAYMNTSRSMEASWSCLSLEGGVLGRQYQVLADCTWTPTGERLPLPPLNVSVLTATLTLDVPSSSVIGYSPLAWVARLMVSGAPQQYEAQAFACKLAVLNATSISARMQSDAWFMPAGAATRVTVQLLASPDTSMWLRAECVVWGKVVTSSPSMITAWPYVAAMQVPATSAIPLLTLSSASVGLPLLPLPAFHVVTQAFESVTCSLAIVSGSLQCPSAFLQELYGVMRPSAGAAALLGDTSRSALARNGSAVVDFSNVGVIGGAGCVLEVVATCRDAAGRSAVTASVLAASQQLLGSLQEAAGVSPASSLMPAVQVNILPLRGSWSANTTGLDLLYLAPSPLPSLYANISAGAEGFVDAETATYLSCFAAVVPEAAAVAEWPAQAASTFPNAISNCRAAVVYHAEYPGVIQARWACLSAEAANLAQRYVIVAECTWVPTGERLPFPPLTLSLVDATVTLTIPSRILVAYTPLTWQAALRIDAPVPALLALQQIIATCRLTTLNSTSNAARLESAAWSMNIMENASVPISLLAATGTRVWLRAECSAWGRLLTSLPQEVIAAGMTSRMLSTIPTVFVPSDLGNPWPVQPGIVARVEAGGKVLTDVTCSLSTLSPTSGVQLLSADGTLSTIGCSPLTGDVLVPPFVVSTNVSSVSPVRLALACTRPVSGDAAPPVVFELLPTPLRLRMCTAPSNTAAVAVPLPLFTAAISMADPGISTFDEPCEGHVSATQLPHIACDISLDTTATTLNDTSNVFLRHTLSQMHATTHLVAFPDFTLVAPQGEQYTLTLACAIGSLPIPPELSFRVEIEGCPPGQASSSVTCVTCGGNEYSTGGLMSRCTKCPAVGVQCADGILTMLPSFYRAGSQTGQPIGPDTELHPCYNSEACTMNTSTLQYGCAHGYMGPLCGVCDTSVNYARFGEACALCWPTSASLALVAFFVLVAFLLLGRVALRRTQARSDAAVALRITLSYLQAVGSLRVFVAGGTKAYHSVMGWTDVVSASPLSVGALDCVARFPFLVQYLATICLPVIAAAAVFLIFFTATTLRAAGCCRLCRCTAKEPVPADGKCFDVAGWKTNVREWLQSRRHMATLLFVLFLAYMPITSASLRVLDCTDPIDGTQYLRSNLSVECNVGQHFTARLIAYVVLLVVGVAFPLGLAWLLGTATLLQLVDKRFQDTWAFLFHGYCMPRMTVPAGQLSGLSGGRKSMAVNASTRRSIRPSMLSSRAPAPQIIDQDASAKSLPDDSLVRRGPRGTLLPPRLSQPWRIDGHSRMWWESLVLARKAGVVLLAVLVSNAYLQTVGAVLWFFGFYVLQMKYQPYERKLFNRLESLSLLSCFFTAAISCAQLQYNVGVATSQLHDTPHMQPIEWATTILLLVVNLGTFAALVLVWLWLQLHRAEAIVRKVSSVLVRPNMPAFDSTAIVFTRAGNAAPVSLINNAPSDSMIENPLQTLAPSRKAVFVDETQIASDLSMALQEPQPLMESAVDASSHAAENPSVLSAESKAGPAWKNKRDSRRDFKPYAMDVRKRMH